MKFTVIWCNFYYLPVTACCHSQVKYKSQRLGPVLFIEKPCKKCDGVVLKYLQIREYLRAQSISYKRNNLVAKLRKS